MFGYTENVHETKISIRGYISCMQQRLARSFLFFSFNTTIWIQLLIIINICLAKLCSKFFFRVDGNTETATSRRGGEKAIAKTHHDWVIFAVIYHYLFMHRSFVPCNLFVVRQWMQIKLPEWTEWWRWAFNILYHWWPRHHAMKRQNAKFDFDCGGSCIHI